MAGFNMDVLTDVDGQDLRTHCYVLQDLDQLMHDRFTREYGGEILWRHKVVGVGQDAEKAWVDVETPEGRKRVEGDYVVGCDGASSMVRRSLFGDEFPGFTWDAQIIATNVGDRLSTWRGLAEGLLTRGFVSRHTTTLTSLGSMMQTLSFIRRTSL